MGQVANILDFRVMKRANALGVIPPSPATSERSKYARLIPGGYGSREQAQPVSVTADVLLAPASAPSILGAISGEWQPRFLERFRAAMLVPATLDAVLILLVAFLETWTMRRGAAPQFSTSALCVYISAFLVFSIGEELYSQPQMISQAGAVIRALMWATLFGCSCTAGSNNSVLPVLALSSGNLFALVGARWLWRTIRPGTDDSHNVLIVGSGRSAQRIADAIRQNTGSQRHVKGFMSENHLRNVYGPSMLSRIAREQFVDELIIASADPAVGEIAVREARRNALDVRVVPEICVSPSGREIAFENVGGIPLLKVQDHCLPEYALGLKRIVDFLASLIGVFLLWPIFLLIAGLIKLGSPGPALYRAERIGSKGREFLCYKFRTMVTEADEIKPLLRSINERQGAFFKLVADPRITRVGKFLRRYSLDELPQLWNVLRGEMSLVGPRPHPPDDVSLYNLRHLQRLDFVPGMTGLWQVTARRDPSFERSVELDVEYINKWSLWLDARILWRTVFAVLQGSGA